MNLVVTSPPPHVAESLRDSDGDIKGYKRCQEPFLCSLTTYTYDAANQLQTSVDFTGVTTYTYDAAGNQQLVRSPAGALTTSTWNDDNRQVKVALPGNLITTNTYRADGLRYQKQDSSGTTRFIYDGQAYLAETGGSNSTQAQYTQEPAQFGGLVSQRRKSGAIWTPSYALFDAIGTTRRLLAANQAITDIYILDAFGNSWSATGSPEISSAMSDESVIILIQIRQS